MRSLAMGNNDLREDLEHQLLTWVAIAEDVCAAALDAFPAHSFAHSSDLGFIGKFVNHVWVWPAFDHKEAEMFVCITTHGQMCKVM